MGAEGWVLVAVVAALATVTLTAWALASPAARLVERYHEWRGERILRSVGLSYEEIVAAEGTSWIDRGGSIIISETASFGWLVSGYHIDEPPTANGAEVAQRQLLQYQRRRSARWDDPIQDRGERVFRVDAPLRGFETMDHLDQLVADGRAWTVVDTECGYPASYVLRGESLPEAHRCAHVEDDAWVYVEAWDAS